MLPVHVYDDGRGVLAPLTDLRPAFDVRTGALSNLERLRLSWGWWDGTVLAMAPAEDTLAAAAALLVRDEATLPGRYAAVEAAEALAATERVRVEALIAELDALQGQLDPGSASQAG